MVDTRIGRKIGDYEIIERIGHGGMSEVFRAVHVSNGNIVALKLLHAFHSKDPNFLHRFEREAQAMSRLNHPNIVSVSDFDVEGETPFIAMQFVPGGTLKDRFKQSLKEGNLLPFEETARIVIEIADALAFAHRHDMVHRDIKPANILFEADGRAVLTDFGIVKTMDGLTQHTATGAMIGTPAYMSPEQGLGRPGDARSDVYALGTLFFQMVTGKLPFDADKPLAVVLKHINDPIPFPTSINRNVPDGIESIILKALAKNPLDRFQTAQEMADALRVEISNSEFAWAKRVPTPLLDARPIGVQRAVAEVMPESTVREALQKELVAEPAVADANQAATAINEAVTVVNEPTVAAPVLPVREPEPTRIDSIPRREMVEKRVPISPENKGEARRLAVTSASSANLDLPVMPPAAPRPRVAPGAVPSTARDGGDGRGGLMYWLTMSLMGLVLLSVLGFAAAAIWGPLSNRGAEPVPGAFANTPTPIITFAPPTATAVSAPVVADAVTEEPPTAVPTEAPQPTAIVEPTAVPTTVPTAVPTEPPTAVPTEVPTELPTEVPTEIPTEVPTEAPTEESAAVADSAECTYSIELLNAFTYNIATNTAPISARFPMNWTLRNNGTCTLPAGLRLVYESGESFGQSGAVELTEALEAGKQATVTTTFESPETPGRYDSRWQVYDQNNNPVGQELPFLVLIYELEPTPDAEATAEQAEEIATEVPTATPEPTPEPTATPEVTPGELGYNVFVQQCEYAGSDWRCLLQIVPLGDSDEPYTIWVNNGADTFEYENVTSTTHWAQAPRCEPWENAIQVLDNATGETITREVMLSPNNEPISTFLGGECTVE